MENIKKIVGETFLEMANALESGSFGKKIKIGLTTLGSEHGENNMICGAIEALRKNRSLEVVLIGKKIEGCMLEIVQADDESAAHSKMEQLLDSGEIEACVTMHYSFPIGVSTVGRVITPGSGKQMYIATTTGTSATQRSEAMLKNAIAGIAAAKAAGIEKPTVGVLNVDNARSVERALKQLEANGYDINFGDSVRSDGGSIMRGNDLLAGAVDVMVTDSLTGNILMKMFSSYTTGGSYESLGSGYGPGIGQGYERNILILSRASGAPVVAGALQYAYELAMGDLTVISNQEFKKASAAGLGKLLEGFKQAADKPKASAQIAKEVVTESISGIDIMDLENAVDVLKENGIYSESGMGCTGPIVLVNERSKEKAIDILSKKGFASKQSSQC